MTGTHNKPKKNDSEQNMRGFFFFFFYFFFPRQKELNERSKSLMVALTFQHHFAQPSLAKHQKGENRKSQGSKSLTFCRRGPIQILYKFYFFTLGPWRQTTNVRDKPTKRNFSETPLKIYFVNKRR